ncbi:DJ-1/PfpI family protein [Aspergillus aculeatinus CBS 121060]|uniref:DJ-1/PfpI family protein n=1 Tax=Aspergillus aculeatinus CBS 121060 TaxID=1448322 RepID=A0ACD1GYY1_9EURO|nr:DJ-1/PfpI family protein [Aspergillus aculeatinus CBS 121060]RAH66396.1 DJ-1/PfpI family protein [Aspergillus aculeatinus CBS 121060]
MSSPVDLRNPGRPIHVGVVLLNTVTEQLDIAPVGFFSGLDRNFLKDMPTEMMDDDSKAQGFDFVYHWVNEDGKTPAKLTTGMNVLPTDSFATCPPLDIILIGASRMGYKANEAEKEFLRKSYNACTAMLCVCGGFEPVLSAGLMEGKTATGPRFLLPMLRELGPGVNWVEKRWVQDGKIWTTGALLSGFDMVAAFGRATWGDGPLVGNLIKKGGFPERDIDYLED